MNVSFDVDGRSVTVPRPTKVLFPADGLTKQEIVSYYRGVAPVMLPHLRGRPVVMQRFPDGIDGGRIVQHNVPEHFPDWISRVRVSKKSGGHNTLVVCDDTPTLLYLAGQACLTPHPWLSTREHPAVPDRLVFDLDPTVEDLAALRTAVRRVGEVLDELGLVPFLTTTGSRGFHVLAPVREEFSFDQSHELALAIARLLVAREPGVLTVEQRKKERGGRVFVDYLRNGYAQTAVAPYAVRARRGAPVATPLWWSELDSVTPASFTVADVPTRLRAHGDPWERFADHVRSPEDARSRLSRTV
ncbi:ATP-dependent DNA ligase [Actinopolyspora erythraea]|uniref:ATP-dependent DNA ligase n=1 Tax=Actinopolyspora erythraea TaxID=414996 RepID=A0A099D7X3_9ACTN|nr:non-homologous end-joining DNA ligase [Actinopolyspora erythraea]ASU78725.1 ATP-dependent DNA ligase [Actinopolyspora erythraea]KGI81480.1 ATP-dependent DNA ligase [Actinopolyspora erythraea]